MAVQALGAPAYIGGAAVVAGAIYLMTPEGQRTAQSLGEAMGQGAGNAVDNIKSLIWGEEESGSGAAAGTETATASDTARCPMIPYVHYTDASGAASIMASRMFQPGPGGGVYFTQGHYGPYTIWSVIFIGNPLYIEKAKHFVDILADCTVPISLRQRNHILSEYFHPGALRERPPNMRIITAGPNFYPEAPDFVGMVLP